MRTIAANPSTLRLISGIVVLGPNTKHGHTTDLKIVTATGHEYKVSGKKLAHRLEQHPWSVINALVQVKQKSPRLKMFSYVFDDDVTNLDDLDSPTEQLDTEHLFVDYESL